MAITNGYATLLELKARLGIPSSDTAEDALLEANVEAASRAIDNETSRVFYATTATRYFDAASPELVLVDDLLSLTTLKTDDDGDGTFETTWASTEYVLWPYNTTPKTRIKTAPLGGYRFPTLPRGVEVVGSWGYSATTPDAVNEACLLLAARLYKRKDAPLGLAPGGMDTGAVRITARDHDVKMLLGPFKKARLR